MFWPQWYHTKENLKLLLVISFAVLGWRSVAVAALAEPAGAAKPVVASSRVVTCTLGFPLDSVQFSPEAIEKCLSQVSIADISYIHVVATATPTGSMTHNLYLSTRRAGAIEGYLKNRLPDTTVHAFGGGINPKFGKKARIFIVEGAHLNEPEAIKVASLIEEPTKAAAVVYQTVYRRPEAVGYLSPQVGLAQWLDSSDHYQLQGLGFALPLRAIFDFLPGTVGASYQILRANHSLDLHHFTTWLAIDHNWSEFVFGLPVISEAAIGWGALRARQTSWQLEGQFSLGYQWQRLRLLGFVNRSQQMLAMGTSMVVEI